MDVIQKIQAHRQKIREHRMRLVERRREKLRLEKVGAQRIVTEKLSRKRTAARELIQGSKSLATILRRSPGKHRELILQSYRDLEKYNLLQPTQSPGVKVRQKQWEEMAGRRAIKPSPAKAILGLTVGLVFGIIMGLPGGPLVAAGIPAAFSSISLTLVLGPIFAIAGAYGGHVVSKSAGHSLGTMMLIINEREDVSRKELVTAEARIWVPKVLMAHRMSEWRRGKDGRPYMWLMLRYGAEMTDVLHTTDDALLLPDDPWRSVDAAVYSRRALNRTISDSALVHSDAFESAGEKPNPLMEVLPRLTPAMMIAGGIIIVIMRIG